MLAHLLSVAAAGGVVAALGMATPWDEAGISAPLAAGERAIWDLRTAGPGRSERPPLSMTLRRGGAVRDPAIDDPALLRKVHDHDDSDTPVVEFVPAPETGQLILVRHADRDPGATVLNATGEARALSLPAALADLPLDAIFITDFRRNADTAAPLAEARGLVPEVRDTDEAFAAGLAQAASRGSAIWIGNVGNLSYLWDAFRLPGEPPVEYGDIAVLTAEGGVWRVTRRAFAP